MSGASRNLVIVASALLALVAIVAGFAYFTIRERGSMGGYETPSGPTPTESNLVVLAGSGSTFVFPQMDAWVKEFTRRYPSIRVEYNPTGSGTGQTQFMQKVVDFAASDPPLPRNRWEQARSDPRGVIQLPIVIGGVVIVYNIPGFEGRLKLDGETLALIYLGEIEYWDDPAIQRLNPELKLPH